jgi:uncharacterized protein YbjT (DUF2867 family)
MILLVGGTGILGTGVVPLLTERGLAVRVLTRVHYLLESHADLTEAPMYRPR